jgi:hypothetical protein
MVGFRVFYLTRKTSLPAKMLPDVEQYVKKEFFRTLFSISLSYRYPVIIAYENASDYDMIRDERWQQRSISSWCHKARQ